MFHNWWTSKNLVFVVAAASLVCVVAVVTIGMIYPEPVPSILGPDWQCSRLALVFTICRPVVHGEREFFRVAGKPPCPRPR
jgi:hypothetical protein